jgi:hypothetical protein
MAKEYVLGFENAQKSEEVVRKFLLQTCTILRLTMVESRRGCLFPSKIGGKKDPKFLHTLQTLEVDYLEEEVNSLKFTNIEQGRLSTHYYYRVSSKMKALLEKQTLLWSAFPASNIESAFYGLEDPTFCREVGNEYEIIGAVISHEPYIHLYLEPEEKAALNAGLQANNCIVEWY